MQLGSLTMCKFTTRDRNNGNIQAFEGGGGYIGVVATTWVAMGAKVPTLSPADNPYSSQRQKKGFGNFKKFSTATYKPISMVF